MLEWDGSSLQDATFEEARDIMSRSGDTVQVVLMHCRYMIGLCLYTCTTTSDRFVRPDRLRAAAGPGMG